MAFKLAQKPSYTVPVKVHTPNDKGTFDTSEFKVQFKRTTMEELNALKDIEQVDVLLGVIVGFSDLLDENDKPVDFNDINLSALLDIPQAQLALKQAFWESIFKAETKN